MPRTPPSPWWRRRAVQAALAMDILVVVGALGLLATGASPIVLAFGAVLAIAPWASIIDELERPRR